MTFSLISVAVLCIMALVIVIEVVRAIKRGRNKTLVTLASIFLATFVSIIITRFLSDALAMFAVNFLTSSVDISSLSDKIASIDEIIFAYSDALISPLVFFLVFLLMRLIIAIIIKITYKIVEKKEDNYRYESENAPQYKKNPNLINGLLGALCGVIVMTVAISPIMGSVKITSKAFKNMNEQTGLFTFRIKASAISFFEKCSNDFVGNVIYYCGGNLVYKSVATSNLNDNYFGLEREIDNTFSTAGNLLKMDNVLNSIDTATESDKAMLKGLGGNVNKAETLKCATADILPELSKKWLNDEPYEGAKKPKVSKACETFFDKMLYVCKSSTPDTVGADLSTLLNVYLIAYENDILVSENYKEMLEKAKATGAFDLIKNELSKNPRMSGISLEIDTMGMKSIATALQSYNFENYEALMSNITNILNNATQLNGQEQLDYISKLTKEYINEHGIDIGDDVVSEISERLVDELIDSKDSVTVDDLKAFWDKYSVKKTNNSGGNNYTPPETLLPSIGNNNNNDVNGDDMVDGDMTDDDMSNDGLIDDDIIIRDDELIGEDDGVLEEDFIIEDTNDETGNTYFPAGEASVGY